MTADFGHLRSGERRAWLGLVGILLIIALIHMFFGLERTPADWNAVKSILGDSMQHISARNHPDGKNEGKTDRKWNNQKYANQNSKFFHSLKPFNPNTVSQTEMSNMGFPPPLIKSIIGYRTKIGPFKSVADFETLYTHSEYSKNELRPFLIIPKLEEEPTILLQTNETKSPSNAIGVNLNTADSLGLIQVRGIGPYYAKLILRYRERLGGFIDLNQLKEIRNLPDSVFQKIAPQLIVDPSDIRLIFINKADETSLAAHPYIGKKEARAIVAYRNQHGSFQNANSLKKILSLEASFIGRIIPYLDWSE